jgi:preprotein translocase subunit SecG
LGALFLVISLGLALLNRTPGGSGVESAGRELSGESAGSSWLEDELNAQDSGASTGNAEENAGAAESAVTE